MAYGTGFKLMFPQPWGKHSCGSMFLVASIENSLKPELFPLIFSEALTKTCCSTQQACSQQDHARGLRNFTSAAKPNLSHVLKSRAVDGGQTNGRNELSVNGRHCKEVLAISVYREIVFKKTTIDVDTLDVDND
jgi:hypothetical protein